MSTWFGGHSHLTRTLRAFNIVKMEQDQIAQLIWQKKIEFKNQILVVFNPTYSSHNKLMATWPKSLDISCCENGRARPNIPINWEFWKMAGLHHISAWNSFHVWFLSNISHLFSVFGGRLLLQDWGSWRCLWWFATMERICKSSW